VLHAVQPAVEALPGLNYHCISAQDTSFSLIADDQVVDKTSRNMLPSFSPQLKYRSL